MQNIPIYEDVISAARRIENYAYRTPVLTSRTANEMTGARLFFKCENYQQMGAFKFRGAFNALFVCLGGGGLLSRSALAARYLSPGCKIYGVEPEAGNDAQQSFRQGKIIHIDTSKTIADARKLNILGNILSKLFEKILMIFSLFLMRNW
ncbi:conserved hypothetical protein [Photorhabdus asymbiotica]|uniref:Similar to putative serine-threonine dehydratase n=1 Tax=Photorhabdus asymbiotica subsp. asymbiotica (strain ATCC 43949 / 3105-77) TaxID=553480 RepID=B6VMK6_PHOAA|nr:conserved hypothetical protein [Photorhabdus asymbiotica]CAR67386.1 similar to putative serine-threonine dehydratase [Photorhabdus asymbiotica subsp. asymbiotica ATCC 43949]